MLTPLHSASKSHGVQGGTVMGEIHRARRNAVYSVMFAGVLLTRSLGIATAQQPQATPIAVPSPSPALPDDINAVPSIEPGFQGVPSAVAPLPSPGQNSAPKPTFSEPVNPSQRTGIAPGPASSLNAPPSQTSQPSSDISLNDLKAANDVRFRIGGTVRATYDSNIFIQPQNETGDLYTVIAPSFTIGSGSFDEPLATRHLSFLTPQGFNNADLLQPSSEPFIYLSYTPSYTAFLDRTDQNSFDHDVIGETQITIHRLTLGGFARFQTLREADTDFGNRVREQLASAHGFAYYALSAKTQLASEIFLQNRSYSDGIIGSFEIWAEQWLDYKYSDKTTIGPGVAVGWLSPTQGSDQYYGRFQTRATWKPTGKLSFAAKGGIEVRIVSGRGNKTYPLFGLEARYAFSDKTSASLSAFQDVRTSASIQSLNYIGRGLEARIDKKILDRYNVSLAVGYINTEYDDAFAQIRGGFARTDNFVYINPGLTVIIDRYLNCALGFQYRNNDSTDSRRAFTELLTTFGINYNF